MNLGCKIYISRRTFTAPEEAIEFARNLASRLESSTELSGYRVVALTETQDFEDEDIDQEIVESVTSGQLPAIYVNLTFDREKRIRELSIESPLRESGMELALSYPTQFHSGGE